jgi:uncharacterized protein YbjT (DUF2867 family)
MLKGENTMTKPKPILVTGAAGGEQGSTGAHIAGLLIERGFPVRAFVHKLDTRSDHLRDLGAEVFEGDLLNPASVRRAMKDISVAYFTYPVADGLLEATTIFALAAREVSTELVVNLSQLQSTRMAPSFRNLQHRLADSIFDWAEVGAVHLHAPPFYENVRKLVAKSVADQNTVFLPWGPGDAVIPLVGAEDVARVATTLLTGTTAGRQRAYELIAEVPSVNEITNTLGRVLRRPIRYVEITDEQWVQAVAPRMNAHALDHLSHLWRFFRTSGIRKGDSDFQITETIRNLTGTDPQTLEQFFEKYAAEFGGVREGVSAGSA